jgi:hypothetical protein
VETTFQHYDARPVSRLGTSSTRWLTPLSHGELGGRTGPLTWSPYSLPGEPDDPRYTLQTVHEAFIGNDIHME